jgi:hypothetical protein
MTRTAMNQGFNPLKVVRWAIIIGWIGVNPGWVYGQSSSTKAYIYLDGKIVAVESGAEYSGPIPTPQLSYAAIGQANQIEVRWCIGSYVAAHFDIEKIPGGTIEVDGGQGCISWYDTNLSNGNTYAYRVRAKDYIGNTGSYSARDIATLLTYSNDPLAAGTDLIRSQHFTEMRQAVASVRTCAGLGAPTWTDSNLSGVQVKAIHLTEIRDQLNEALDSLAVPRPSYTDASIVSGVTVVKATHIQEIRNKLK